MTPAWTATLIAGYALAFRMMNQAAHRIAEAIERERFAEARELEALEIYTQVQRELEGYRETCDLERLYRDEQ